MTESTNKHASRSEATRQTIIRAAEQLFAQHGVAATSVNTISQAAQQKNKNAVQYHFGGKQGLLQAIFDKHSQQVAAKRADFVASVDSHEDPARAIAEALILPLAAKLDDDDGGEAYIHISAELAAANVLAFYHPEQPSSLGLQINNDASLSKMIARRLTALPPPVLEQRVQFAVSMVFHTLSDHARLRNDKATAAVLADSGFMVANLVDSITAILTTPVSEKTKAMLTAHPSL